MSTDELQTLFEHVEPGSGGGLCAEWRVASNLARRAYEAWLRAPGGDSYAVYRAAADRADAAQESLARAAREVSLKATAQLSIPDAG